MVELRGVASIVNLSVLRLISREKRTKMLTKVRLFTPFWRFVDLRKEKVCKGVWKERR